ncbi:MAG: twitching motility protein PilT, partial [Deltaproteobacteria bacterium]
AEVEGRVPPRILREHSAFLRCPGCERVYWSGSHTDRMRRVLEAVLGDPAAP